MACAPDYCVLNSKDCHSSSYRKERGYIEIEKLSAAEVECLQYRSGIQRFEEKSLVCFHHYTHFVKKYPSWFKVCCDPFQKHSRHVRSTLREISLEDVKRFENFSDLIPGKKLCFRCFKELEGLVEPIREPDECNDDICWVPFEHIISTIKAPKCQSGEQVYFEDIDIGHILSCFDNLF